MKIFFLDTAREANLNGWELDRLMYNFTKELYPKWFRSKNEEVMSLLLQGYPVVDCYKQVLDRGETQGNINDIKPKKNAKKLKN